MLSPGNNKKKKSLRASNVELQSREISVSKNDDKKIYSRDFDNLGPLRQEKVINNSPTGKRCAYMMSKFIAGNGVDDNIDIVVNQKGETVNDLIDQASVDIAYQYGVFFLQKYKIDVENSVESIKFQRRSTKVLDYVPVAISKEDDDEWPGKIYILDQKEGSDEFEKVTDETTWYYPYNPDSKVILSQMRNDCKLKGIDEPTHKQLWQNYRGQVLYMNLTPKFEYALPLSDVVYDDMDSEAQFSRYVNRNARNGWLGKTVFTKFDDDEEEDERSTGKTFDDVIKDNMGAENSDSVLVISVPTSAVDDVTKAFKVDQVKAQFDDKMFDKSTENVRKNIMGAFNNIPEILVMAGDGALFGPNSETYKEAKRFYWEQNETERFKLEKTLSKLLNIKIDILPLADIEEENEDEDEKLRKQSQAQLKGSVGGVTALLEIQKSVSEGTTNIDAAVEIIKEIFGIAEEIARRMLGNPKPNENEQ